MRRVRSANGFLLSRENKIESALFDAQPFVMLLFVFLNTIIHVSRSLLELVSSKLHRGGSTTLRFTELLPVTL
jgi:hypothetical protein